MLIIYDSLTLGGIEALFVRIAKERGKINKITRVLLISSPLSSDVNMLTEMMRHAEIYYLGDLYNIPETIASRLLLLSPIDKKKCEALLDGIEHIHAADGLLSLLANRLIKVAGRECKLTVGFYHSRGFAWGRGRSLPYYERVHRKFVLDVLPKSNLFVFGQDIIDYIKQETGKDLAGAPTFRIGVVERDCGLMRKNKFNRNCLRICSVGRLVDFKSYNLWMLDVISTLKKSGVNIHYDIFGLGPEYDYIERRIYELGLENEVSLCGLLSYKSFSDTVSDYDLFVGSGTAIIQASSLGVPSIVGIESINEPYTYGYFKDCCHFEYNILFPSFPKLLVTDLIKEFIGMSEDAKLQLANAHAESVSDFYMDQCSDNFDNYGVRISANFKYSVYLYELSLRISKFIYLICKDHYFHRRFVE